MFKFHSKQGEIVKNVLGGQNGILVCGRGFGKSVAARGVAILNAINYSGYMPDRATTKLFNVIASPHLNHCKKVHWESLEYLFTETDLKNLVKNINRAEGIITLKGDRPGIMLAGINDDNGDKIRGLSVPRLILDEFQDIKPGFMKAITPSVSRCNGSFLICGTPKGKGTYFHKFTMERAVIPKWQYYHYTTKDNPKLPNLKQMYADAQKQLTAREFRAEFEASWEDFPGQIFDQYHDGVAIPLERSPDDYDHCFLGVDWGDKNPSLCVVGVKEIEGAYSYYVLETWEGSRNGNTQTIFIDELVNLASELAHKYRIFSTFPDCFQPGHPTFINRFENADHPGLRNIISPTGTPEQYSKMKRLLVMPSCAEINRLIKRGRFFINSDETEFLEQFLAFRRKSDRSGDIVDQVDETCTKHCIDAIRYIVAGLQDSLFSEYGGLYEPMGNLFSPEEIEHY